MVYPYLRLSKFADVPVGRSSVGAMGLNGPPDRHRPYVYRGTGEDTLEETLRQQALDAEREQWEREARAERRRLRLQAEAQRKYAALQESIKRQAMADAQAMLDALPPEPEPEPEWIAPVIQLFPETDPEPDPEPPKPKRPKPEPKRKVRFAHVRVAPISLDDIEALLEEDDDD